MRKILNTLRYGRTKTKTLIISVFVLMVAAIGWGIIGINGMNIILLGISMVLFIICIFMVFKLEGVTKEIDPDDEPRDKGTRPGVPERKAGPRTLSQPGRRPESADTDKPESGAEPRDLEGREKRQTRTPEEVAPADNSESRRQAQERLLKTLRGKSRGPKAVRAQLERKLLLEIIKAGKRRAAVSKKTYRKRMKAAVEARNKKLGEIRATAPEGRSGSRSEAVNPRANTEAKRSRGALEETSERSDKGEGRTTGDERAQGNPDSDSVRGSHRDNKTDYRTYTKSEVKRLRKVYKIPKDACRIIIDSCKSLAIDHAPAFFWVKKGRIYLLAFEESARCETMSMNNTDVSYKKNIREDEIIKYNSMREMGVYKDFEEMMPTFSIHGGAAGNEYYKNLYVIGKDLVVTPRSLRSLLSQFSFKIKIFDSLGINGSYSEYFKKAYEQRVMWTDGVISQNQYQNNIRDILQSMVDDDSIIRYDFMDDLAKMVHHRLITDEYAEFYKNKRL